MTEDKIRALDRQGRIYKDSRVPQLIRYLDEMPGQAVGDLWAGYPAHKSPSEGTVGISHTEAPCVARPDHPCIV